MTKFIRNFEGYTSKRKREDIIKESILQVNDIYKVKTMIDVPQSLINAYTKKVKEQTGKNARQLWSDVDIAEEIVKFINNKFMNIESIPSSMLVGDVSEPSGTNDSGASDDSTPEPAPAPEAKVQAPAPETPTEGNVEIQSVTKEGEEGGNAESIDEPTDIDGGDDFEDVLPEEDEEGSEENEEDSDEDDEDSEGEDELPL
jgi:hypothetical protein